MTNAIIQTASDYCTQNGHRLTKPRLHVLNILAGQKQPLKAYDILNALSETLGNPKPPTIYRAIEFWQEHGFIHRIESLNAYIACEAGHRHQGSQFMICNECGLVIEAHLCELPTPLKENTAQKAFMPSRWNLEIHGRCGQCHEDAA